MNKKKLIFCSMDELERKLVISQLIEAMNNSNESYYKVVQIISEAERKGTYEKVKFFNRNIHQ